MFFAKILICERVQTKSQNRKIAKSQFFLKMEKREREDEKVTVNESVLKKPVINVITTDGKRLDLHPPRETKEDETPCGPLNGQYGITGWIQLFVLFFSSAHLYNIFTRKKTTGRWGVVCESRFDIISLLIAMVGNDTTDQMFQTNNLVANLARDVENSQSAVVSISIKRLNSLFRNDKSIIRRIADGVLFKFKHNELLTGGYQLSNLMSKYNIQETARNISALEEELETAKRDYNLALERKKSTNAFEKKAAENFRKQSYAKKTRLSKSIAQHYVSVNESIDVARETNPYHLGSSTNLHSGMPGCPSWDVVDYFYGHFPTDVTTRSLCVIKGVPFFAKRSLDNNWRIHELTYYATFVEEFQENPFMFIAGLLDFASVIRFCPTDPKNSLSRQDVALMAWKQFSFRNYAPKIWMYSYNDRRVDGSRNVWNSKNRQNRLIVTKEKVDGHLNGFTNIEKWTKFNDFVEDLDKLNIGRQIRGNFSVIHEKLNNVQKCGDGSNKKHSIGHTKNGKVKQTHNASFKCRPKKDCLVKFPILENGEKTGETLTLPGFKLEWDDNEKVVNVFRKKFVTSGNKQKWTEDYCGCITESGYFFGTYVLFENRTSDVKWTPGDGDLVKLLRVLNNNFVDATAEIGRLTGKCCCCSSELSDSKSLTKGYGPVCEKRWGLTVDNKFTYFVSPDAAMHTIKRERE